MLTIAELKERNKQNGSYWFSPDSLRFWGSKIHGKVRKGHYFITSEDNFNRTERLFTIRSFDHNAHIETVGKFQEYKSLNEALSALEEVALC